MTQGLQIEAGSGLCWWLVASRWLQLSRARPYRSSLAGKLLWEALGEGSGLSLSLQLPQNLPSRHQAPFCLLWCHSAFFGGGGGYCVLATALSSGSLPSRHLLSLGSGPSCPGGQRAGGHLEGLSACLGCGMGQGSAPFWERQLDDVLRM